MRAVDFLRPVYGISLGLDESGAPAQVWLPDQAPVPGLHCRRLSSRSRRMHCSELGGARHGVRTRWSSRR